MTSVITSNGVEVSMSKSKEIELRLRDDFDVPEHSQCPPITPSDSGWYNYLTVYPVDDDGNPDFADPRVLRVNQATAMRIRDLAKQQGPRKRSKNR